MSKLIQLLRGSSAPNDRARKSNTLSTIADLMERNRRFEVFMRQKVAELEEKLALDEASDVRLEADGAVGDAGGFPEQVDDDLENALIETAPDEGAADVDDPEPNDIWPDPAETANFFDPPAGQSLLSAAQLTPRKDADTSHTGPPRFNAGLGADWQAIPGLGGSEDQPPLDEAEIDEAETDDMPDEADDLSWDTPLQAGELGEYD